MKARFILSIVLVEMLISLQFVKAQPPGMPGAPDQAPIDGGLLLVAAGGAAYAIKRLKKSN